MVLNRIVLFSTLIMSSLSQAQTLPSTPFKMISGEWTTVGKKLPDGGFMCATSHIKPENTMTLFTGFQAIPAYIHQNIFISSKLPDGADISAVITLPDGTVTESRKATVSSSVIVIPLDMIILKYIAEALYSEKDIGIKISSPTSELENFTFEMKGGQQAAGFHSDCMKTLRPVDPDRKNQDQPDDIK